MDFELTEEQRIVQKNVRQFMIKEIEPLAEQIDRDDKFPPGIWKKLGELGVLGVTVAEEYGGSGFDLLTAILVIEQMSRTCPALAISYGAHGNLCADNLNRNADEAQKMKYLPGLCSGDLVGCLALTEPNAGSDAVSLRSTAVKDGNNFLINGSKMFITNAPIGDVFLVYAKTEPKRKSKGITAFIVEKDFPGLSVSRRLEKMGNRGSPTGEMVFEDCRVPAENVVGEVNGGISVMMSGLDVERAFILGLLEKVLEMTVKCAKKKEQFGRPIGSFQAIQHQCADMATEIDKVKFLVYQTACKISEQISATKEISMAKARASDTSRNAYLLGVKINGGIGISEEYDIQLYF